MNQFDPIFFTQPSGDMRQPRRLYKGGKSKDPAAFAKEQEKKKEAERQAFYAGTGYNDAAQQAAREAQYGQMETDLTDFHRTQLDKERSEALQQMKFNNARSGLSGSSQAAADEAKLNETYQKGLLDIAAKAKGASSTAKTGYESAFNRGLQQVNAGSDAGTQISSTVQDMANSMSSALENAKGGAWNGFFGNLASTIDTAKVNAGKTSIGTQSTDSAQAALGSTGGTKKSGNVYNVS